MTSPPLIEFSGLRYDPSDGSLTSPSTERQSLRPQVARLLEEFLASPGQVLDRERLCLAVWGEDRVVDFEAGLSALVKELRQALRAVGAPDDMLETVPRRGYRFHADVTTVPESDGEAVMTVRADGGADRERTAPVPAPASRKRILHGALLAVALGAALVLTWSVLVERTDWPREPRLAVVPFEILGVPSSGPTSTPGSVSDSANLDLVLADTLLAALWQADLDHLVLIGRTSMGAERSGRERAEFVAQELGASLVLEGSVIAAAEDSPEGWRIEARLLRLPRGEVVWAATVAGEPGETLAVGEIARTLAVDLAAHWSEISGFTP